MLEARPPPPPCAHLESEVRALHATFEDAGMPGALRRLHSRLRLDFARQLEQLLPHLPEWVHGADFDAATAMCNPDLWGTACLVEAMELVRGQRRVTQLLLLLATGASEDALPPEPRQPVRVPEEQDPQSLAATLRLCFGEMLEAYAAHRALLVCDATTLPAPTATARVQTEFAQLGHDAYFCTEFLNSKRFPPKRPANFQHVGQVFSAANEPRMDDINRFMLKRHAPPACRRRPENLFG